MYRVAQRRLNRLPPRAPFILSLTREKSMESERWRRIQSLYYAALERDATGRAAFLTEACADDEELLREVESLLAVHEQAEGFMAEPALEIAARLIAEDQGQTMTGRIISHYQVLSLLGAGGMGEVYLAEDTRLGRKVALKLLPQKFTQDRERALRFQQEARAASALNHPNILTIYEIGEFEGGQFIATEFIDGQTLRMLMSARVKLRAALDVPRKSRARWPPHTIRGSCTGTSSRKTSWRGAMDTSKFWTSALPS